MVLGFLFQTCKNSCVCISSKESTVIENSYLYFICGFYVMAIFLKIFYYLRNMVNMVNLVDLTEMNICILVEIK